MKMPQIKGYAQASYTLAQLYETGELGVAKDSNKFSQYIQKASAQGSDDATVKIATILFAQKNLNLTKLLYKS